MSNPINKILDSSSREITKQVLENSTVPYAIADANMKLQWFNDPAKLIFTNSDIDNVFTALIKLDKTQVGSSTSLRTDYNNFILITTPLFSNNTLTGYLLQFTHGSDSQPLAVHNLAHDLNNIFTSILNSIELLKKKPIDSDKYKSLLTNIESSSVRAAEIIEDVLIKEKDGSAYKKRKIDIGSIITEIVNNIKPTLDDNITLELNLQNDLKPVYGKYSDLFRVLINLCTNAKEAITKEGAIFLKAENISIGNGDTEQLNIQPGEYIAISVKDNGCGISEIDLPMIFDSKFSTKQKGHQSGLGLNIVKQIVEKHSGHISVRSNPGEFTEFTILLPVVGARSIPNKASGKKTILIAEDDLTLRELLFELLSSYGYNVIEASDGSEVLEKYETTDKIDLMIVDRKMPILDGIECIKKIREINSSIPIILASGSPSDKKDKIISDLKIDRVINKPYDFEYLLSNIEELIR